MILSRYSELFWSVFFSIQTKFSRIQSECRKTRIKITPNTEFFTQWHSTIAVFCGLKTELLKTQKQPPEVFYEKRCSKKFHKIHRCSENLIFSNSKIERRKREIGNTTELLLMEIFYTRFMKCIKVDR